MSHFGSNDFERVFAKGQDKHQNYHPMMYLRRICGAPPKPNNGKCWLICSDLHNTHQIQFSRGFNANKSHKDLTSRLIVILLHTFGYGYFASPLIINIFHSKKQSSSLRYFPIFSRTPDKPPNLIKSQQTQRG